MSEIYLKNEGPENATQMVDDFDQHDPFGIGRALQHGLRMFMHASRRSGRTTDMLNMIREDDVVVTAMRQEAQRLKGLVNRRGFNNVDVICVEPLGLGRVYERLVSGRPRRVLFDHLFFETYYSYMMDQAFEDISHFKDTLDKRYESAQKDGTIKPEEDWHYAIDAIGGDMSITGGPND